MKILFTTICTLYFLLTSVKAEECVYTYETKPEESKYTKQFSIDTDRKGHSVRIFSLESTYKDEKKNCEGLSLVKSYNWGYSDYVNKNGPVKGHVTQIYSDGSKIFATFEGTSQNPGGSKNFTNVGIVNITGGTGIYENISGYGLNKGEFNPETGYSSFEFTLKYTK
tara:strand:- start:110 stop:610 length:501 start_codon:yes stop_codon:yes gene_type:complete